MIKSTITVLLSSITLTASFGRSSVYAQPTNQDVKCMEGVYALEEFRKDGVVYQSPQVSGRYMILNGAIFWIFHYRAQQSRQTSAVGFERQSSIAPSNGSCSLTTTCSPGPVVRGGPRLFFFGSPISRQKSC
jgi:hypothetical protein